MEIPVIYQIKGGWAAQGNGWAVHAATKDEALRKFRLAEQLHEIIRERPPFYEQTRLVNAQL